MAAEQALEWMAPLIAKGRPRELHLPQCLPVTCFPAGTTWMDGMEKSWDLFFSFMIWVSEGPLC